MRRVYVRYEEIMTGNSAVDFDDLLGPHGLLASAITPKCCARYQDRYSTCWSTSSRIPTPRSMS